MMAPAAERITSGVPPTLPNARTGEFTPPGVTFFARSNHASLCGCLPLGGFRLACHSHLPLSASRA